MKTTPHGPPQRNRPAPYALLSILFTLSACSVEPTWVGAPRVPTPVLLGPVDRVGGHRSDDGAKVVGQFGASVDRDVGVSYSKTQSGNVVTERTAVSIARDGTGKLSSNVLRAIGRNADGDARVQTLEASTFLLQVLLDYSYSLWSTLSVDVSGDVVQHRGGAR